MLGITLHIARELRGLSLEEVASHCCVNVSIIETLENDSSYIPRELIEKLSKLYLIDPNYLYFGKEINCIERNRKFGLLTFCSQRLRKDESETLRCYKQ